MDISAIMVHVDTSGHAPVRLSHAAALANAFHATLIGLLSAQPVDAVSTVCPADDHDATRRLFESATERAGLAVDWRIGEGTALDAIHCEGRLADLIVLSRPDPAESGAAAMRRFVEAAIVDIGPPVLVIPPGPLVSLSVWPYVSVIVCWSGNRASARALRDALPVLRQARHVTIACCTPVDARGQGVAPASYAITWLARRGIRAALVELLARSSTDIGHTLLDLAVRRRADLLVCGAGGHPGEPVAGHETQRAHWHDDVAAALISRSPIPALFAC